MRACQLSSCASPPQTPGGSGLCRSPAARSWWAGLDLLLLLLLGVLLVLMMVVLLGVKLLLLLLLLLLGLPCQASGETCRHGKNQTRVMGCTACLDVCVDLLLCSCMPYNWLSACHASILSRCRS